MPEAVFHQTRGGKDGGTTGANELAPPDSQIFQRRVNLGQVFNSKEEAIVGQMEEQENSRQNRDVIGGKDFDEDGSDVLYAFKRRMMDHRDIPKSNT